jgi:hypothetical protein
MLAGGATLAQLITDTIVHRSRAIFAPAPNDPLPPLAPDLWESLPLIKTE